MIRQLRYVAATAQKPVAAVGFNVEAIQDEFGKVIRYREALAGETLAEKYQPQHPRRAAQRQTIRRPCRPLGTCLPDGMQCPGQGCAIGRIWQRQQGADRAEVQPASHHAAVWSIETFQSSRATSARSSVCAEKKKPADATSSSPGAKRGTPGVPARLLQRGHHTHLHLRQGHQLPPQLRLQGGYRQQGLRPNASSPTSPAPSPSTFGRPASIGKIYEPRCGSSQRTPTAGNSPTSKFL